MLIIVIKINNTTHGVAEMVYVTNKLLKCVGYHLQVSMLASSNDIMKFYMYLFIESLLSNIAFVYLLFIITTHNLV